MKVSVLDARARLRARAREAIRDLRRYGVPEHQLAGAAGELHRLVELDDLEPVLRLIDGLEKQRRRLARQLMESVPTSSKAAA